MSFFRGILRLSGILMLSGWMFFMGVIVGRGTSPVEFDTGWFQERLAVIFQETQTEEPVLEKPELDFYSALQKSNLKEDYDLKLINSDSNASAEGEKDKSLSLDIASDVSSNDTHTLLKKSTKSMTHKAAVKQTLAAIEKSSNVAADKIKLSSKIAASNIKSSNNISESLPETKSVQVKEYSNKSYSYTIQIASFNNETDAVNHIAKLGGQGYSAYKSTGMIGEKTWYRIRIGSFKNITEAKENLKKLENNGIKGLIIQKE